MILVIVIHYVDESLGNKTLNFDACVGIRQQRDNIQESEIYHQISNKSCTKS